jgi:preprotein translocase subunit YajC
MNTKLFKLTALALVPTALLLTTACTSTWNGGATTTPVTSQSVEPGAIVVDTTGMTATVTAIDTRRRRITLAAPDGRWATYKVSKDVINFDQIRVGDQVKATVTEELAVFLRPAGTLPSAGEGVAVALAPKGAKPGLVLADTAEVTARVVAVDAVNRRVTLQFADGTTKTVRVNPDINLANVAPGDAVTVRITEALAVLVEKP